MLKQRIGELKTRMECAALSKGRNINDITLVAVTKTVNYETVRDAYEEGISDFGENRIHELISKQEKLPQARWHMIGRLQTNKIKDLVNKKAQPFLIHSLDRWNLARELNKRGQDLEFIVPALLQVNIAREAQKAGLDPIEAVDFFSSMGELKNVFMWGLMTIAPLVDDPEEVRPVFRELTLLRKRLRQKSFPHSELKYLSMGMTQDFEVAIEEGSDIIRIGSALFT